ncbi:response regulator transcription factor [Faecalibacter bovis]|uniref:Response regulator transcription factor n=1 Tax=Faecalibacter bovis TaxID=2898187 RepID=A0ABX7XBA0_9FLAO|nr:response regulator transcription factor [Faecalibacter bovis]QTV05167.1 response regulator transcription factor [Faecalibacter bovis]
MSGKIRIGILDDEMLLVEAFSNLISTNENFEVCIKNTNPVKYLEELEQLEQLPDVMLLDLNMEPMNGLEVLDQFHQKNIDIKVLVLSSLYNPSMYGYMIKYGISGFLPKYTDKEELFEAIEKIHKDRFYFNEGNQKLINDFVQQKNKNTNPWNMISLSEREIEILILICKEHSTKEIADILFISTKTVEAHRSKIMEKIGCKNVVGMVTYAILNGIYVLT